MGDEWYSPAFIFNTLNVRFDLDVCHPARPTNVPCDKYFTKEDDALSQDWHGFVWMNPPYSNPRPFIEKWLDHGDGLALLPMAKSKWFNELMESEAKFVLMPSNMKFEDEEGKNISLMMGTMLWAIGDRSIRVLNQAGFGKVR